MPLTLPPDAARLRTDLSQLTDLASNDLALAWKQFTTPGDVANGLRDIVPSLASLYGEAAGTLSADWYDELRDNEGIARRFAAIVAELPEDLGADALAGATTARVSDPDVVPGSAAWESALTFAQGGLQRRIANMSRETIAGSALADPSAKGWQRVGNGECAFCLMIIGRGQVFTQSSAQFASHDACRCSAVPAWGGRPLPVKPYTPTDRTITDADRARVRAYLAAQ